MRPRVMATLSATALLCAWAAATATAANGQRLHTKPSCQIVIGSSIVRSCGYIEHSDACCVGPLSTRPVPSTQRQLSEGEGLTHSNVTFSALFGDGLYLLSHDEGCGAEHECWEVSLGRLGPLPPGAGAEADGRVEVQVQVSFMAGPKVYNVSLSTVTTSRVRDGPGLGQGLDQGVALSDCRVLRTSTPVLDITGQDATLRLVPPRGDAVAAAAFPPVCITFHSDQCRVDCKDFAVPAECKRSRFHQSVHCVDKPFDSVLTIRNVTLFQPDLDAANANLVNVLSLGGPLQFHCARVQLRGCVLATPTMAVRIAPASEPAEVSVQGSPVPASTRTLLLIAAPLCLALLLLLVARNVWPSVPFKGWRRYPQLPLRLPEEDLQGVSSEAVGAAPCRAAPCRRVVLVYCKPGGEEGRALTKALHALGRILSASGEIEVVDMYEDPCLLEDGAVVRASHILSDATTVLVVVLTPLLAATLRPVRGALGLDPFQQFITTLVLGLSHAPQRAAGRVLPISLDARHGGDFLIGLPITAVYVLPHHLRDLLRAILGKSDDASACLGKSQDEEHKLKMYLKMYAETERGEGAGRFGSGASNAE